MNHNFADWNTTVLFDNTDISKTCSFNDNTLYIVVDEEGEEDIVILDDRACYSIKDCVKDNGYLDSREVITWEDIRLYLLSKGIRNINIEPKFILTEDNQNVIEKFYVRIKKYSSYKDIYKTITFVKRKKPLFLPMDINYMESEDNDYLFDTYEEARKQAIIYCIDLIKHN
jgi:hypothetical protein